MEKRIFALVTLLSIGLHANSTCEIPSQNHDFTFCKYQAENEFTICLSSCSSDPSCSSTCTREYDAAFNNCPCQTNCPGGCPCSVYDCASASSVLVLSTRRPYTRNIIVDVNGREDYDFNVDFDSGTEAWESCTVVWHGEMFIYGGWKNRNQISKLANCKVEQLGELPFFHRRGGCAITPTGRVYLCFHYHSDKLCYQAEKPGVSEFASLANSTHGHRATRIAYGGDSVIVVGGADPNHGHTEVMSTADNEWQLKADYPFHDDIYNSPVVYFDGAFIVFGGKSGSESVATIAGFFNSPGNGKWSNYGDLQQARRGHGAIYSSGYFLVVGGYGFDDTFITEKCWLDNEKMTCKWQYPDLFGYWYTPELALIPHDFCKLQ